MLGLKSNPGGVCSLLGYHLLILLAPQEEQKRLLQGNALAKRLVAASTSASVDESAIEACPLEWEWMQFPLWNTKPELVLFLLERDDAQSLSLNNSKQCSRPPLLILVFSTLKCFHLQNILVWPSLLSPLKAMSCVGCK